MTESYQQTNSGYISSSESYDLTSAETTASTEDALETSALLWGAANPTKDAQEAIKQITSASVYVQAKKILLAIRDTLRFINKQKPDVRCIPSLHAHRMEDEALLIEWVFPDFRIGFNIEPDPKDTGWHVVAGENLNDFTTSERLTDFRKPVELMLELILFNT